MIGSPEQHSSDTNVRQLKEELNIERHEWPSKRELYTICGKLGEGATGNVSRIDRLYQ
jgi:serine/threonine protein kinase